MGCISSAELLVQAFFKPGSAINKDHKEKYLHILAYAASVYDNEDEERYVCMCVPYSAKLQ